MLSIRKLTKSIPKKNIGPKIAYGVIMTGVLYGLYQELNLCCLFDHKKLLEKSYGRTRFELLFDVFKTESMCIYAIQKNFVLIEYVPERLVTDKLWDAFVKIDHPILYYQTDPIQNLPDSRLTFNSIKQAFPHRTDKEIHNICARLNIQRQHKQIKNHSVLTEMIYGSDYIYDRINNIFVGVPEEIISQSYIDDYSRLYMKGKHFMERFPHLTLLKLANDINTHHGFEFIDGVNDDRAKFNPLKNKNLGIHTTDMPLMWDWLYDCKNKKCHLWDVTILPEATCQIMLGHQVKFDILELSNCREYVPSTN